MGFILKFSSMSTTSQLNFLQEKINAIGSAIFFNLSDSVLKFPTAIVTTLKVDDFGYVWFYVQKPKQNIREFEVEFPVRLDFFKKGKNYFLQVLGKASVISDPEDVNSFVLEEGLVYNNEMVLVKVKMLSADYHETNTNSRNATWWKQAMQTITSPFRPAGYGSGNSYIPIS